MPALCVTTTKNAAAATKMVASAKKKSVWEKKTVAAAKKMTFFMHVLERMGVAGRLHGLLSSSMMPPAALPSPPVQKIGVDLRGGKWPRWSSVVNISGESRIRSEGRSVAGDRRAMARD